MAESIGQVSFCGVPDECAPAAGGLDEALGPQLSQGFAEKRAADTELGRHFRFGGQPLADYETT